MAGKADKPSGQTGPLLPDVLRDSSDAIWIVSAERVLYTNTAAVVFHTDVFGTRPEVGQEIASVYPEDELAKWSDRYERALEGETVYALETFRAGKRELVFELVFDQFQSESDYSGVVVIARSIADRRRISEGTTFEARAVIDSDTYVLFANPQFKALIGIAPETPIRSLRLRDLLESGDEAHFAQVVAEASQDPTRMDRLRILDLDGQAHETVGTIAKSPDSGNLALALLDISRQIETELRLERHAEHLQALHAWAAELNAYMEQPEVLYQRSLELLSNTVRYDSASVQLLKDDHLTIVACAGFPDAAKLLGVSFPFDSKYPNWNVVTSRETISVADAGVDYPHFRAQSDEYDSGHIASWLGVPLGVHDDVLGMVALDRTEIAPFTDDERRLVATMAEYIAVAVHNAQLYHSLQESEEQLVEANRQKEVLLRELHHRSKNNMQMISSLLSLGAAAVSVEEDGRVLDEVRMRIQSLAAVHEELYRSDNLDSVDLADYARRVTHVIVSSYGRAGISVDIQAEDIDASIDVSVPFGLILSELVLNSYKHAFPDSAEGGEFAPGSILVQLTSEGDEARLVVQDDGIGLSREKWGSSQESLGMQLVTSLVDQIGGNIDLTDGPGTKWVIRFPIARA